MGSASNEDSLWNGEQGAGGISWADRSRMGPLRGVIDAADLVGRRNLYMHTLHARALKVELQAAAPVTRALDFGCGTGRFIKVLSARSGRVIATDKELPMIEAARAYAAEPHVDFVRCEPAAVPAANAEFDFVLCSSVLCVTIAELIDDIIAELARVTKPGGTLLLLEQVAEARGLAASRYYDALRGGGFKLVRAYPIRPAFSVFTQLVTRYAWIPVSWFEGMAALELFVNRRRPCPRTPYVEYAIVARRQ